MYIKKGVIYTNFAGTSRYRVAGFNADKDVIAALLQPPGGSEIIAREEFEREFAEEASAAPAQQEVRETLKKFKGQKNNPYVQEV